ncbi:MAG: ATP-binding protein [Chloroflexota bacterium]|nr:ATP-binding protein [Chloroflexota bacterium]
MKRDAAMFDLSDYQLRQRDYLLRISQAISAQLDLQAVLGLVVEYAVELVAGNYGFIALFEGAEDELRIAVAHQITPDQYAAFKPLLQVLASGAASREQSGRELWLVAEQLGLPLRQMVGLPLLIRGRPIGMIVVFRAAVNVAFTVADRALIEAFASQAAIAVQNARLYQAAVQEQERLNAIIEQSADGVMILDRRWRITTFNRAMELLTGWSREEALGRPCAEVLGIHNEQDVNICLVNCPLQRLPRVPNPTAEGKITTRDGRERYVSSRYSPTYGPDDEFLGAIANVRDVTARKLEEQQQATFVSVISHELKTPVAIIKGYAGTLGRPDATWDEATLRDGLQVIEEEADRLNELIGNLLDVSRLQAGGLRLHLGPVDLPALTARLTQGLAATASDQFEFQLRFPPSFPPVHADEERIRMVLANLLSNAVKYSPQGGVVRVGGWTEGDQALIYVSDQGVGIAPEDQQRVFERFYRVDNSLGRQTQGAGLGLYLARAIVEAHGGQLRVESQPGRGSRFIFTLPLERRSLAVDPDRAATPQ